MWGGGLGVLRVCGYFDGAFVVCLAMRGFRGWFTCYGAYASLLGIWVGLIWYGWR